MRVAFIAAGLGSALGFYGVSVALNAEPPDPASTGWVAVLTPVSTLESDVQVRVNAFALDHRSDPRMAYGLSLCGADSFSGYFLIGGGARLSSQDIEATPNTVRSLVPGDIEVDDVGTGQRLTLKDVQVLEVQIGSLPPCVGAVSEQTFVGTGFRVEGIASEPVVTSPSTRVFDSAIRRSIDAVRRQFAGRGKQTRRIPSLGCDRRLLCTTAVVGCRRRCWNPLVRDGTRSTAPSSARLRRCFLVRECALSGDHKGA